MSSYDVAVIGGGLVGAAIAYGLIGHGLKVAVVDEGDVAYRASRGNFGLVWVQGKGASYPPYAAWTRRSAELWPDFAAELEDRTGIDIAYRRPGGLDICIGAGELAERAAQLEGLSRDSGGAFTYEVLDNEALRARVPGVSSQVCGATYSPHDGHVNPLALLRALHRAIADGGGGYLAIGPVARIEAGGDGFTLTARQARLGCGRVVLAAGLGNLALAPQVGLDVPVTPNRGQILVTERLRPFIDYPTALLRQTAEGSVQIGDSHEEVGLDAGTSAAQMRRMAAQAVAIFPFLRGVRLVRAWGALRIMTPDGVPVYDASASHPGAFAAACHSGVTLAAAHARLLPAWIAGTEATPDLTAFSAGRFDVQGAA